MNVAIIGAGTTPCSKNAEEFSHKELLYLAAKKAFLDAGIERKDVGTAVTASFDILEGRGLSNQYTLDSLGGVMKPCDLRVGEDGLYALFMGTMEALTNPDEIVVVGSVQKGSERDDEKAASQNVFLSSLDPVFVRPVISSAQEKFTKFTPEILFSAMEAKVFMKEKGVTEKHCAQVAGKNYENAMSNRNAIKHEWNITGYLTQEELEKVIQEIESGVKREYKTLSASYGVSPTVDEILQSNVVSEPIHELEIAEKSDAACVLVLASEKKAKELKAKHPVWLKGMGWCSDTAYFERQSFSEARALKKAAQYAYEMAGIKNPEKEISFMEVYDAVAYKELLHLHALLQCENGTLTKMLEEGMFHRNGKLPVNVSGGLLGMGNPVGTGGLVQTAYAVSQLRGTAGSSQLKSPHTALVHASGSALTQAHGVVILRAS